ncbi:MAG: aminoglycoside phosphotransferase family protein [Catenulispora sp.]|nr:aminoglycoside phosphotransferase family protein [Catenulispora sp.]
MHDGQLTITTSTVRELIEGQFPQWRGSPVRRVGTNGTVNAVFRIGEDLAARFRLLPDDVAKVRSHLQTEAEAATELAAHTRFPTPTPVALGEPGAGYPLPWSVQTWLPGVSADEDDPSASTAFAEDLAEFITEVRAIDTRGRTFVGHGRGGDLRTHDAWLATCFARSEGLLNVPLLRRMWADMRELPPHPADTMTHGDLIPGNVLVADGRLAGILDTGTFGAADPSLDLVAAWHLLEAGPRLTLRARLAPTDLAWQRGKAWAFAQAMGLVWYYRDTNPTMARTGRRTLERIVADTDPTMARTDRRAPERIAADTDPTMARTGRRAPERIVVDEADGGGRLTS